MINGVEGMNIELYAFRSSVRAKGISFYADVLNTRGECTGTVTTMEVKDLEKQELYQESKPLFDLSNDMAQKLFDQLYSLGYRPNSEGSVGELAATKDHLADMRKIAFDQLNI
jgi:hypothetical protein